MSVYFIQAEDGGPIKIGYAADPESRRRDLQTSHHQLLVVRRVLEGGVELERQLHERFKSARITGEWFRPIKRVAKFGNCIPQGPRPKKPRIVYRDRPWSVQLQREYERGLRDAEARIRVIGNEPGLLSLSERLHIARIIDRAGYVQVPQLRVPALEFIVAYLDLHSGDLERIDTYRAALRHAKEHS